MVTQFSGDRQIKDGTIAIADLSATGTPTATTFYRGDNTWSTPLGISRTIASISTATTGGSTSSTDYSYFCTAALTFTLPTAVGNTNQYEVINQSTGTITVATTSAQTINGSATATLPIQNMTLGFKSNGTNWQVT